MSTNEGSTVKTVETAFHILDVLLESGPVTRKELESQVDLATSSVYRHLTTLVDQGYVIKDGNEYRLSFKFLTVGCDLRREVTAYPMIKQKVDELAAESDERAQFIVRENQERVYLYTEIGENPVQTGAQTGKRGPIHTSAAGKSIIANLPKQTRENLLQSFTWESTGPNTITDPDDLRDSFADIRERGYALNLEETTRGVHAIGAPVFGKDDQVLGALSIAGPATRLKVDRLEGELLELLLATTNELELYIEHGQLGGRSS